MRIGKSLLSLVALTGLVVLLVACGQDHDDDHGHAHEGDNAHTHDSAPETEAFYSEEGDTLRDTDTSTDERAHDHSDGETHAH